MIPMGRLVSYIAFWVCWLTACSYAQSNGDVAIELSGFSVSEAYDLNAGAPLDLNDSRLMRLLFRSGKISTVNFEKWSRFADEVSWQQLADAPRRFRFWTINRSLTLKHLSQIRFPQQVATDELKGVYLAQCVNDQGQNVYLVTRRAPRKLTLEQPLDQPISFTGFFYNIAAVGPEGKLLILDPDRKKADQENTNNQEVDKDGQNELDFGGVAVFIANHFAWYPATVSETMGVNAGQVQLAAHGVDIGLFDYVRKQNSKALSELDSDAFYQMLAAISSIQLSTQSSAENNGLPAATPAISFTELMSAPTRHFGNAIQLSGRLRQCVPIQIVDADRRLSVGLDKYYQVSLFPDLKGRDVIVRTSNEESIKFEQFPVTVCLPRLPQGMTADQLEGRAVQLSGNFYRFIKYQSKVASDAGHSGQISPLVMASNLMVAPTTTTAEGVDLLMRVLLIVILATVAIAVAYSIFKDRKKRSRLVAGDDMPLPEKIDLSQFEDQIED